ncbi:MAG: ATP-binding protein [Deltaproteobacteria bacterium]
MTRHDQLKTEFRLLTDISAFTTEEQAFLERFLEEEARLRQAKKIAYLLTRSGIKRIKTIGDFDWKFNPVIPRDKLMVFMAHPWLKEPCNLVLIGPAGVGKTHLAKALCHDAVMKGHQALFISLFDLMAKFSKANNLYNAIDFYAKVPVLCLDEVGYAFPSKDQADAIFQVIAKRAETKTTIMTTNLVPSQWNKVFDATTATAILDRLTMNGTFLTMEGRSYRSKK